MTENTERMVLYIYIYIYIYNSFYLFVGKTIYENDFFMILKNIMKIN